MKQNKNGIMFLNKHNTMIKSKYNLNVAELRIYLFILYSLQKDIEVYKNTENVNIYEDYITFSIKRNNFSEVVSDKQYLKMSKLENLFEGLRSKPVYYEVEKKNKKKDWSVFGFILKYSYRSDDDSYVFVIDKVIYDMVIKYKAFGYTPLNLALLFSLTGVYSYRLYELLRLWSNTKAVINYSVDEIKEYFMLNDKKSYNTYSNFKNKVILPAIKELNDLELFEVDIKENKVGRKVDSIDFIVKDLDKRVYFKEEISNKVTDTVFTSNNKKEVNIDEFYIPNERLFVEDTPKLFINDFKDYDFKDKDLKRLLQEAILVTLEKDDVDKVLNKSYNFFKRTLENKINDLNKSNHSTTNKKYSTQTVKTRYHNINQTFTNYTPEELERLLLESQKDKFK